MPGFPRNAAALLVGIGEYRQADRIATLRYASHDARSLARLLADPEVCGFPRERIAILTDSRAGRAALDRHLSRWLPRQARGAELVFLYFAGHGVVESVNGQEEGYLVPWDTDPDDIVRQGLAMSDLARWIDALGADTVVVCLDCCHAGGILPSSGVSLRGESERDLALRPSVLQRLGGRGRFLLASCDRGQKSIESDDLRHGLFTYHLLRGLNGAGDRDGDGYVSIAELFSYVASAVSHDARTKYLREQTPWTSATYNGDVLLSAVRRTAKLPLPGADTKPIAADNTQKTPSPTDPDAEVIHLLRRLRRQPDLSQLSKIFGYLAHKNEDVRRQAHRALSACPWEDVCRSCEAHARGNSADSAKQTESILDGLGALETHARVIALLDRLAGLLRGTLRDRAIWLLDRKRIAADRDRLAEVFRSSHGGEILRLLGPGTYTGAYLARLDSTGLEVVVRVLRPEFASQPIIRAHFVELGVQAVRLVHHNLVLTRDARSLPDRNLYFTVRDYIPGATLREVLESGRRFDPLQSCKILRQVLEALTPLHRDGISHGGIKPSNVFLTHEDRVILGEPSLSLPASSFDLPRLSYDFRYYAPEQFAGIQRPPLSADFYSLGCVAHELFRGQPPFVSDNHFDLVTRHARDAVPTVRGTGKDHASRCLNAMDDWLQKALSRNPGSRFGNLEVARTALAQLEQLLQPPATQLLAMRAAPPQGGSSRGETLSGIVSDSPSSIHLLRDQSLMDLADRQSLVPLSRADGAMETFAPPNEGSDISSTSNPVREIPGYRIEQVLGQGGMGVVYKATDVALQRPVALKMIRGYSGGGALERRFLTEAQVVARVQHPNIVTIHQLGEVQDCPYMVMEFCGGGTLAERLKAGPMPPDEAAALVTQLAQAIQAAHSASVMHRDLKPANVLFSHDGTPKITDFGLARKNDEDALTTTPGMIMGTPSYMAPEQARGDNQQVGPLTDIYGLGAVLYECLTGKPPFRSESALDTIMKVMTEEPVSPRTIIRSIPRALEAICLRCLQKNPKRRYQSAAEVAAALSAYLGTPGGGSTMEKARARVAESAPKRGWRIWPFGS